METKDHVETTILKLRRKYSKDDLVEALVIREKNLMQEIGILKSERAELVATTSNAVSVMNILLNNKLQGERGNLLKDKFISDLNGDLIKTKLELESAKRTIKSYITRYETKRYS